jgi:hypothetical protein
MTNKQAAIKVVEHLCSNGFRALFAGGCVRDMLLGRRANDYDVATDAAPRDVIKLFRRTLKVGAKFGWRWRLSGQRPDMLTADIRQQLLSPAMLKMPAEGISPSMECFTTP